MIYEFIWIGDKNEDLTKFSFLAENFNYEVKTIKNADETLNYVLMFNLSSDTYNSNNSLSELFNLHQLQNYSQLKIQLISENDIVQQYIFSSTALQVEYVEKFSEHSLKYLTRLIFKNINGGQQNAKIG